MNYFELFDIPNRPIIDKTFVAKKFFELQRKFHPDFFTQANEAEQENVIQQSADINKAYKIFQNQEETIAYFLQQQPDFNAEEKYNLPPNFLMEMMDLNETLMDDPTNAKNQINQLMQDLKQEIEPVLHNHNYSPQDIEILKSYYFKKKYLNRILDRLSD